MTAGAERKRLSEKNQNLEGDATAEVFPESEGFVSYVHLVKSIFHLVKENVCKGAGL